MNLKIVSDSTLLFRFKAFYCFHSSVELNPNYYELTILSEQKLSSNENDCYNDCINDESCVQFILTNGTCYLKKSVNIYNSILAEHTNSTVRSIKSTWNC